MLYDNSLCMVGISQVYTSKPLDLSHSASGEVVE